MLFAPALNNAVTNSKGPAMLIRKPEENDSVNLSEKNPELLFIFLQSFIFDIPSCTNF